MSLLSPPPRVIKNGIIARPDLYPRSFYDNTNREEVWRAIMREKNAWTTSLGWSWVVNREEREIKREREILSMDGII